MIKSNDVYIHFLTKKYTMIKMWDMGSLKGNEGPDLTDIRFNSKCSNKGLLVYAID